MWITSACEGSFGSCLSCGVFPSGARGRASEKVSRAARRKSCGVGREASERGAGIVGNRAGGDARLRSGWPGLVLILETEAQGGGAQAVVRWLLKLSCGPNHAGRPAGQAQNKSERLT